MELNNPTASMLDMAIGPPVSMESVTKIAVQTAHTAKRGPGFDSAQKRWSQNEWKPLCQSRLCVPWEVIHRIRSQLALKPRVNLI